MKWSKWLSALAEPSPHIFLQLLQHLNEVSVDEALTIDHRFRSSGYRNPNIVMLVVASN